MVSKWGGRRWAGQWAGSERQWKCNERQWKVKERTRKGRGNAVARQ